MIDEKFMKDWMEKEKRYTESMANFFGCATKLWEDKIAEEKPVTYAEFQQLYTLLADMLRDQIAKDKMEQQIMLEYLDIRAKVTDTFVKLVQQFGKEIERRKRAAEAYIS